MPINHSPCVQFYKNDAASIRLFCFHYAGGNANLYQNWHMALPRNIELLAIELPGRMNLLSMKPYTDMHSLINYLSPNLLPYLMDKPFVFFGHSLGALISFELARFMQTQRGLTPIKLISSACQPPRARRGQKKISTLSEQDLIAELIAYNNTPRELLENKELMQIVAPIIRADFMINETYNYLLGQRLNCPITVYGGIDDVTFNPYELDNWRLETSSEFKLHMLSGDHFFVFKQNQAFLHQLNFELASCTTPA
jgi:medium-chain acyl-[acyl-carrier-protein] hydrolase